MAHSSDLDLSGIHIPFISFPIQAGPIWLHKTCAMMWRIVPCSWLCRSNSSSKSRTRSNKQRSVETCLLSFLFPLFPTHDTYWKNTSVVEIVCGWRDKCDLPRLNFLSRRFFSSFSSHLSLCLSTSTDWFFSTDSIVILCLWWYRDIILLIL